MENKEGILEVGPRIFFDQDGGIIHIEGPYAGGANPRKELTLIDYVDVPYGEIDLVVDIPTRVDPLTKEIEYHHIVVPETEEQRRIRELEDALLLQAENEIGGVL